MEFLTYLVDFILHIDAHLFELVEQYGMWIYAILFIIVFCETGLVVTPFLPGDSLLFASGVVAGAGLMGYGHVLLVLLAAGIQPGRDVLIQAQERNDISPYIEF